MMAMEKATRRATKVIKITSARYQTPYKVLLLFDDGKQTLVDCELFLRASQHPSIQAYFDKRKFKSFTLEDGFLHWNDFDLVFPMADLYAGKIS